jgi:hypothetical protein
MTVHTHLFYNPGELAKVGQIWIVDSLGDDDRQTGRRLREDLEDHITVRNLTVPVIFRRVCDPTALLSSLDELQTDIEKTGRNAILHLECHGSTNCSGLVLRDGSYVPWDDLKPRLQAINLASRFNLFLILGCCNGGYVAQIARLEEPAAFCALLGPNNELGERDLLDGLRAFYTELLTVRDATAAFNALRTAVPDFPYFYTTAEGLFRLGFAAYIREETTAEQLSRRAQSIHQRLRDSGHPDPRELKRISQTLKDLEKPEFDRCRRAYFALDLYPENEARFTVSYDDVNDDATREH